MLKARNAKMQPTKQETILIWV